MPTSSWIGQTIGGRYRVETLLGQGGMSAVYRGTDADLRRTVAIKLIYPHLSSDPEFARRFEEQAAAVAQLRHPNIIQVFDFNHDGDIYYMVLEYLPGETLQSRLKALHTAGQRLPLAETLRIMTLVCEAVAYAHARGMIHRDLKPATVMLSPQGQPILMDFGLAKILGGEQPAAPGAMIGAPAYMSPEQVRGERPDHRTDIYSLGVMLFEMVTGRVPFDADTALGIMLKHVSEPAPDVHELNPAVPEGLIAVVEKALAKRPADRFQSAHDMARALKDVATGGRSERTLSAPPPPLTFGAPFPPTVPTPEAAPPFSILAPAPGAAPLPAIVSRVIWGAIIGSIALGGLLVVLSRSQRLLLAGQMILFTAGVCLIPTLADLFAQRRGRVIRILLETTLFTLTLIAFSLWLFGRAGLGSWIVYAIGLILVLEIGSHLIERYMTMTLQRIFRSTSFRSLQSDAEIARKMFRGELVLYVPVPLSLWIGTVVGLISGWTTQTIVVFCVQVVLMLASLVLLVFLINAFVRMTDPLFRESKITSPQVAEEAVRKEGGLLGKIGRVLRFLVPPPQSPDKENQEQQDLSLAQMITDLRKVYLYDSVHNVILLVAFFVVLLSLWNIPVDGKWIVAILIGLGLVFCQLPFVIGQSLLHEKVLDRYEGVQRANMAGEIKKSAPLFPATDFLTALFTTGTAGGLVYYLLDQFVKGALK
jgi:serine/threonine-protein kinase